MNAQMISPPRKSEKAGMPTKREGLRISLERASTKVRSGPPKDEEADYDWPVWAGVLPVRTTIGEPVPDPRLGPDMEVPDHIRQLADTTR